NPQIPLTERFGQYSLMPHDEDPSRAIPFFKFPASKTLRNPKPKVAVDHDTVLTVPGEDSSKRRQILDGARKVFMDLGFDGASMGEIARAAAVSKGTLYVYFADKCALFEAILEEETLEQGNIAFNFDPARDVPT